VWDSAHMDAQYIVFKSLVQSGFCLFWVQPDLDWS